MAGAAVCTGAAFVLAAMAVAPGPLMPASMLLLGSVLLAGAALSGSSVGTRKAHRRPYKIFMLTQSVHLTPFAQFPL